MEVPNEIEQSIVTEFRRTVWEKFLKGIREYDLINEGDRIAVCISGGKDSMLMAMCMKRLPAMCRRCFFEVYFLPAQTVEFIEKICYNISDVLCPEGRGRYAACGCV